MWLGSRELGDDWPFTVSHGNLRMRRGAILFTSGGVTYAVNGTARTRHPKMPGIDPIWRDNPAVPGTKIPISALIRLVRTPTTRRGNR